MTFLSIIAHLLQVLDEPGQPYHTIVCTCLNICPDFKLNRLKLKKNNLSTRIKYN